MFVCLFICLFVCLFVYCLYACVCVCGWLCVQSFVCVFVWSVCVFAWLCVFLCLSLCARVALCVCACVWSRGRASICAVIPRIWGPLASLAAAVSAMCYVGGVCVACCRALFDKPEPGAGFVRLCCRGVAFQPAVRSHTKDLCGARNIGGGGSNCVLRRRFLRRFLRCADARLRGCVRAFYGAWRNQNTTATGKPTRHSATRQRHPKVCHTW